MVLLSAIALGLIIGFATGGSLAKAAGMRIGLLPVLLAALLVQVAIFTPIAGRWEITHSIGPYAHIATLLAVLFVMLRNLHIPGMKIIVVGAALNALVITANGGFMPSPESALERAGRLDRVRQEQARQQGESPVLSNSEIADDDTRLLFLGDVIAIPDRLPLANVISIGDIVIAAGAVIAITRSMHRKQDAPAETQAPGVAA
ncbi:MAG TPA: DUF5317 domain-containing protein [Thermomicrobiales bacterium]|nr:DUF5317 domain-containing protein [Thermomicrobiales bacterium]